MNLIWLALLGPVEAIVYLHRYRSANRPGAMESALSTVAVCVTRAAFTWIGASAVIASEPVWAVIVCYAVPAAIVTYFVHPSPTPGAAK